MSTETTTEIVRVRADEAKRALAEFSAADERLAYLYRRYGELRAEHWPSDILPDAVIAIGTMNDKTLCPLQEGKRLQSAERDRVQPQLHRS